MAELEIKRKIARRLGLNEAEENFLNRTLNNKSPKHDSLTLTTNLTMEDGANVDVGTSTGTQIGTGASQKLGFFGTSPVAQQTAPASLTDNSGGTSDDTVEAVSGSGADAAINNNFAELTEEVNQLRTIVTNLGLAS